jgi:phytoene dehydrogenase-like protein
MNEGGSPEKRDVKLLGYGGPCWNCGQEVPYLTRVTFGLDDVLLCQQHCGRTAVSTLNDEQLSAALDSTLADLTLAVKYPHNAHLRPKIVEQMNELKEEQSRRSPPDRFEVQSEQLPYEAEQLSVADTDAPDGLWAFTLVAIDPSRCLTPESRRTLATLVAKALSTERFQPEYTDSEGDFL